MLLNFVDFELAVVVFVVVFVEVIVELVVGVVVGVFVESVNVVYVEFVVAVEYVEVVVMVVAVVVVVVECEANVALAVDIVVGKVAVEFVVVFEALNVVVEVAEFVVEEFDVHLYLVKFPDLENLVVVVNEDDVDVVAFVELECDYLWYVVVVVVVVVVDELNLSHQFWVVFEQVEIIDQQLFFCLFVNSVDNTNHREEVQLLVDLSNTCDNPCHMNHTTKFCLRFQCLNKSRIHATLLVLLPLGHVFHHLILDYTLNKPLRCLVLVLVRHRSEDDHSFCKSHICISNKCKKTFQLLRNNLHTPLLLVWIYPFKLKTLLEENLV